MVSFIILLLLLKTEATKCDGHLLNIEVSSSPVPSLFYVLHVNLHFPIGIILQL